jgi:hypothetical protein
MRDLALHGSVAFTSRVRVRVRACDWASHCGVEHHAAALFILGIAPSRFVARTLHELSPSKHLVERSSMRVLCRHHANRHKPYNHRKSCTQRYSAKVLYKCALSFPLSFYLEAKMNKKIIKSVDIASYTLAPTHSTYIIDVTGCFAETGRWLSALAAAAAAAGASPSPDTVTVTSPPSDDESGDKCLGGSNTSPPSADESGDTCLLCAAPTSSGMSSMSEKKRRFCQIAKNVKKRSKKVIS